MEQIYTQIRQYIDENRQPMLNLWCDLVNTESGTLQIDGVNAVCSILRREMENAGIHTRVRAIQNSGDMLIGEWNPGSSKAPLLLIGHMDTVFKEGAAKDNPFRVDENGMAHGPGVLDMKAGLVMALYTVKALDSVDWKERPIKFIFASDEENLHMHSDAKEIFAEEAAGALTLGQASMMLPACILMGTLIGHYARIVLVTDTNKKWHPLLIAVCLLDAAISLVIMRVILAAMGVQ